MSKSGFCRRLHHDEVFRRGRHIMGPKRSAGLGRILMTQESLQSQAWAGISGEPFRLLADLLPNIVLSVRPDGNCVYANERFYEFTGIPHGAALGQAWAEGIHPEDLETIRREWDGAAAGDPVHETRIRIRSPQGEYRWFI